MNVAAYDLTLSTQRVFAEPRPRSAAPLAEVSDARRVGDERESREPFGERRKPRRVPDESPRSLSRRDGDERGRRLDVYC